MRNSLLEITIVALLVCAAAIWFGVEFMRRSDLANGDDPLEERTVWYNFGGGHFRLPENKCFFFTNQLNPTYARVDYDYSGAEASDQDVERMFNRTAKTTRATFLRAWNEGKLMAGSNEEFEGGRPSFVGFLIFPRGELNYRRFDRCLFIVRADGLFGSKSDFEKSLHEKWVPSEELTKKITDGMVEGDNVSKLICDYYRDHVEKTKQDEP